MSFGGFPTDGLAFLADLSADNRKEWFDANRSRYQESLITPAKAFVGALGDRLRVDAPAIVSDPRVNGSIFRINRDTRFSADKTPYKTHLDLMLWEGTGRSRDCPALFVRLTPTRLHLGGGMHGFDKARLAAYRTAVAGPPGDALVEILATTRAAGFTTGGEHYKRVPKGFLAEHPRSGLLKHNALHVFVDQPVPESVHGAGLVEEVATRLLVAYPVVHWIASLS